MLNYLFYINKENRGEPHKTLHRCGLTQLHIRGKRKMGKNTVKQPYEEIQHFPIALWDWLGSTAVKSQVGDRNSLAHKVASCLNPQFLWCSPQPPTECPQSGINSKSVIIHTLGHSAMTQNDHNDSNSSIWVG